MLQPKALGSRFCIPDPDGGTDRCGGDERTVETHGQVGYEAALGESGDLPPRDQVPYANLIIGSRDERFVVGTEGETSHTAAGIELGEATRHEREARHSGRNAVRRCCSVERFNRQQSTRRRIAAGRPSGL